MAVSRTVTFEQTAPRRPAEADILAGSKTNATPTVPPNIASAEEYEQMARLLVALGRVAPLLRVAVNAAPSPSLVGFQCVRGDILAGDINVHRNSVGNYDITWPSGRFPTPAVPPTISLNYTGGASSAPAAASIANGVNVQTWNLAGAHADLAFTVEVY